MATDSNINLNYSLSGGNMGIIGSFPEPGIPRGYVYVPKGTSIPAAQMVDQATFNAYVTAKLTTDVRNGVRWFAHNSLDDFKDLTKAESSEDTGLEQYDITSYDPKHSFRVKGAQGNMGNYIESRMLHQAQGRFDIFIVDDKGQWQGAQDPSGGGALFPKTPAQIFIPDVKAKTDKTDNQYMVRVQFASRAQFNENYASYAAGTDLGSLVGLENAKMIDVTAILGTQLGIVTTTTIVAIAKYGQDSRDLIQDYLSTLTAACFKAVNLTTGATLTISSITKGSAIAVGQTYWYVAAVLSAAPASTTPVQLTLQPPSVVNPIFVTAGVPAPNVVVEILQLKDGQNAAVHTFA